jgi:hypothetical protein
MPMFLRVFESTFMNTKNSKKVVDVLYSCCYNYKVIFNVII